MLKTGNISITAAQESELAEVEQLYRTAAYNGGTSADDVTVVARSDGRLIAAVRLCDEGEFKVLRGMQVHPDFQRQGIGSALLSHCSAYLDDSHTYCLPYIHLVRFYAQIQFVVADNDALPPVLAARLVSYVESGRSVVAMTRLPSGPR